MIAQHHFENVAITIWCVRLCGAVSKFTSQFQKDNH